MPRIPALIVALSLTGFAAVRHLQAQTAPAPVPVLVELFTSEGCSSCPPADEVLTRLVAMQPVPGAHIIALGEHVDYWDHLGWRDAFSSPTFSRRQTDYVDAVFHGGSIYTPQLVVNGRQELVGSDYRRAVAAIAEAVKAAGQVQISLTVDSKGAAQPSVNIRVAAATGTPLKTSDIWLAVVEDGLTTRVMRGENGGRTLQHSAVVRTLRHLAVISGGSPSWASGAVVGLAADWKRPSIHVVAFVQDHSSRQVLGAAEARP